MAKWKKGPQKGFRPRLEGRELVSKNGDNEMKDAATLLEPLNGILGSYVQKLVEEAVQRLVSPPPPTEPVDKIYTVAQAAPLMGLSEFTVREKCRLSRVREDSEPFGVKLGSNKWGIRQSEIDLWWRGQVVVHGRKRP